jgi:hypothetical protein
LAHISGNLLVIDTAAAIDRLLERLQRGVREGWNIEAERIDAGTGGALAGRRLATGWCQT